MQIRQGTTEIESSRILLPLDLRHCSLDVFRWINRLAQHVSVRVALLHVVNLNIFAADNRAYEELGREAFWHLRRLSEFLHPSVSCRLRVRVGMVAEEIIAEAKAEEPELVVLTAQQSSPATRSRSFWRVRSSDQVMRAVAQKLVAEAQCLVVILPAQSYFDCESIWGRPVVSEHQNRCPARQFETHSVL
jgi:nucleotide-binding universal stress UspA family protein